MKIACIAWGSLLWKPEPLKLASAWHADGPRLPLEFVRDSDDSDELAIIIHDGSPAMPTFWALLDVDGVTAARRMLAQREKISLDHPEWVGSIPAVANGAVSTAIEAWMQEQQIDAVVWTALPPKFGGIEGCSPTADEAVAFLAGLRGPTHDNAREYVRRTPPEIRTPYRERFERDLGWTAAPST